MTQIKQAYLLLDHAERRRALMLLLLLALGTCLELLGVGMVLPVVALMTQADIAQRYPQLAAFFPGLAAMRPHALITLAVIALALVFLLKNIYLALLVWWQTKFAFDVQANISRRLFSAYLQQPYTFHLQRNSAQLIRNVSSEVAIYRMALSSALVLISEALVIIGMGVLLLAIEPLGTLVVTMFFAGVFIGLHLYTRDKLSRWGQERKYRDGMLIQHLQQGFGGIKEIKLLGREDSFLRKYHQDSVKSARAWKFQTITQQLPRLVFELLSVSGLALLIVVMLHQGREVAFILPALGVFAAAAFRMMPSVNRMLVAVQALKYSQAVMSMLHEALDKPEVAADAAVEESMPAFSGALRLLDVAYTYPERQEAALEHINLSLTRGESLGIIGASGSGKSTLVDLMLGLLLPSCGALEVDGRDMRTMLRAWQRQVGYVPQTIFLTDDSLRRNIALGVADGEIDEAALQRAIRAARLDEFVAGLERGLDTPVGERGVRLSGGQRQRVGIARALYHDPALLVLDEATSALDDETERGVMDAVEALRDSKTIIVVAHRLSTIAHCDRYIRLEAGKITEQGTPAQLPGARKAR